MRGIAASVWAVLPQNGLEIRLGLRHVHRRGDQRALRRPDAPRLSGTFKRWVLEESAQAK